MKVIKYLFAFLLLLVLGVFVVVKLVDEPLPAHTPGVDGDLLARKMLSAVNDSAWSNTGAITWRFIRPSTDHKYVWDKTRHLVQAEFEEHTVQIDINKRTGIVLGGTSNLSTLDKVELCEKAWKLWVNDSFWMNPVSKIFDPGTSRSVVALDDGTKGLLVTYSSGGATPGDSYLWIMDDSFRPVAWKFWVSIIPVGGLEFTWNQWIELSTGAWVSTNHEGLIQIQIVDARGKETLEQLTGVSEFFRPMLDADENDLMSF